MLNPGDTLGRYELLCPLARGGMAEVWAARLHGSRGFQKVVAIKTILSRALSEARLEQMFLQEAHLVSHIHHANVAQTLELGEDNGTLFIVMEWVHGEPMRALLDRRAPKLPPVAALNLIGQAARGLHAAHVARDPSGRPLGIVHRDVSPQNLLVTYDGTVKVLDFGVAKALEAPEELTEAGELKGKLAFMSPEQLRGEPLDARSDIFSLAEILYWALTGRHPYLGAAAAQTRDNIARARPPAPPSIVQPRIGTRLDAVVLAALSAERSARPSTAYEFYEQLACACPQAFTAIAQAQLEEHLDRAFKGRAEQRKQQLVRAQQMLDPMRSDAGMVASLDGMELAQSTTAHRTLLRGASLHSGRLRRLPTVRAAGTPRFGARLGIATATGLLLVGVATWALRTEPPKAQANVDTWVEGEALGAPGLLPQQVAELPDSPPSDAALTGDVAHQRLSDLHSSFANDAGTAALDAGSPQDPPAASAKTIAGSTRASKPASRAAKDPVELQASRAVKRARKRKTRQSQRARRRRANGPSKEKRKPGQTPDRPPQTAAPAPSNVPLTPPGNPETSPKNSVDKNNLDVWDLESFGGRY